MTHIRIGHRLVGDNQPCYIIAEIGINHNGSLSLAKEMIEKSAQAGADAVKFQKRHAPSMMVSSGINRNPVGRLSVSAGDILEGAPSFGSWSYPDLRLELLDDDYYRLKELADSLNVEFIVSPWDDHSTDFIVAMGVRVIKIPSVEIRNPMYLKYVAQFGLPLIMSTGTADDRDVERAVATVMMHNHSLCLLQCTSSYPSRFDEIDLRVIATLRARYQLPTGYSGHEPGIHVPVAAVALGACVVEKHVTLNRKMSGPDHAASIEIEELQTMVRHIREVEQAMGSSLKSRYDSENVLVSVLGKSVVSHVSIPAGTIITIDMLTAKGPSTGIPASEIYSLVGKKARVDISADSVITLDSLE